MKQKFTEAKEKVKKKTQLQLKLITFFLVMEVVNRKSTKILNKAIN